MSVASAAPRPPRSLRATLAMAFAAIAAVQAAALAAVLGHTLADRIHADEGRAVQAAARVVATQMADGLAQRTREVVVMAASPTLWLDGLDAERVRQVFARSQAVNPHAAWIGVTDADGIVRAATGGLLEGVDVSQRPWFIGGRNGAFVGDVHPAKLLADKLPRGSDGGPQRFVDFAAPIHQDGRLIGVVAMHGSWDWAHATIGTLLPALSAHRALEIHVIDRHGQTIYAPGTAPADNMSGLVARAIDGAFVQDWPDDVSSLAAGARVKPSAEVADLGWTVLARVPTQMALAPVRAAIITVAVLGVAAALGAAVAGSLMSGRLTRPLRRLARSAVGQVAENDAPTRFADSEGPAEVRQLAGALTRMTAHLRAERDMLEQRVADRTRALADANTRLETLSRHDPLTGLLNRRGFEDLAATVLADARRLGTPVSVLVFDIDHFKQVNDRFGHEAGDAVLRALARLLKERLREVDVVARFGGEEFVVLLPRTSAEGAAVVATQLVGQVASTSMPPVGSVTVSCGAAELAPRSERLDRALARADAALYAVKRQGRNGWRLAAPGDTASTADHGSAATEVPA